MSDTEVRRAGVLARVKTGELKLRAAADMMEVSYRQAKRLWKRYRRKGSRGLVHGHVGKRSNQAKPHRFRQQVLQIVRSNYSGDAATRFGPTLAAEHLGSDYGLEVSAETLRLWMLQEGLWSLRRKRKEHRRRRERREHFGELVQLDGSFHDWFEGRGPISCLMNMVDDATTTTLAEFHEQETIWAAVDVLRAWIEKYGVPRVLYTDWKNVYVRKPREAELLSGEVALTQFGRMCAQLGIRIIAACSPQAKGRVERNHGVHQDRLVKKLRLQSISTREAGNDYLRRVYLPDHNRRFHKRPSDDQDYHRAAPGKRQLDEIFRIEQQRVLSNDWVVRYEGRCLQLDRDSRYHAPVRARVTVYERRDGSLQIGYRGHPMRWHEITERRESAIEPAACRAQGAVRRHWRPGPEHPWRKFELDSQRGRHGLQTAR